MALKHSSSPARSFHYYCADTASPGIEFLDTTIIHVEAIVDELLR